MDRYHSIGWPMVSYHWKPLKNHRVQWLSDQKPSKTNGWSSYWKKHHYYSIACPMVSYFWKPIEYNCTETKTIDHSIIVVVLTKISDEYNHSDKSWAYVSWPALISSPAFITTWDNITGTGIYWRSSRRRTQLQRSDKKKFFLLLHCAHCKL